MNKSVKLSFQFKLQYDSNIKQIVAITKGRGGLSLNLRAIAYFQSEIYEHPSQVSKRSHASN